MQKPLYSEFVKTFTAFALAFATLFSVNAATHTWTGAGGNGLWSTAGNWTGGAPTAVEAAPVTLVFPNGVTTTNNIVGLTVDSLQLSGGTSTLRGSGGGTLIFRGAGGTNILSNIPAGSSHQIASSLPVTFNSSNYCFLGTGNSITFDSLISGAGTVTYDGPGLVRYSGISANTATGKVTVKDGITMYLSKTAGLNAIAGALDISDAARVLMEASDQISDSATVSLNTIGELWLQNNNETVGAINISSGQITMGTGILTLNGNITTTAAGGAIWGKLSLGGVTRTIQVGSSQSLSIWAAISDGGAAAGLIKNGAGQLSLRSANSFSGAVTVNVGTLDIADDSALGTTGGGISVQASGTLRLSYVNVGAEAMTLAGTLALTGTNSWAGAVTIPNENSLTLPNATQLTLSGVVGGAGSISKSGVGTLVFSGTSANTFSNGLAVNAGTVSLNKTGVNALVGPLSIGPGSGTVRLQQANQIADTVPVAVYSGGTLDLNGSSDTIGSIEGSGTVTLGFATLTTGGNNVSTTFGGALFGIGFTPFIKNGSGTFTLSGTNACSGTAVVNAGALVVNGELSNAVTVNSTASLSGGGKVGNLTSTSGTILPGDGVGKLTTGNLTLNNAAGLATFELTTTVPGIGHDQIAVTGTVAINNATLSIVPTGAGALGNQYVIIANDGSDAVTGTFNGLAEGATINAGVSQFTISYHGDTGNDVVLTQTATPPKPQVTSLAKLLNGQMQITGSGLVGYNHFIEANTNLTTTNWITIGGAVAAWNGAINFTDTDAVNYTNRFYRFRLP